MPALRLFVALPAPAAVRESAARLAARLRGAGDVRWVAPENLHLTLRFLGATAPDRLPDLEAELKKMANGFSRFVVESGQPGAFPGLSRPETIWLAVTGSPDPLTPLAAAVERTVVAAGFPPESRPFRAHLTVGRVREGDRELARRLRDAVEAPGERVAWPVNGFELVRSELRPEGPRYTCVRRFPLAGGSAPVQAG